MVPFFTKVALWKVWWSSYCFIYNGDAAGTTTSPDGMHLEESVKRTQGHPYDWQLINTNSYVPTKFNRQDKGYIVYRVSWTEQLGMKQVYEIPVPPHASCATYLTQSQNGSRESSLWAELVHLGEKRISFFGGLLSQYKLYSLPKIISFIVVLWPRLICRKFNAQNLQKLSEWRVKINWHVSVLTDSKARGTRTEYGTSQIGHWRAQGNAGR